MENDQLSNYVKEQRALGRSSDDIKSELLAVGWQESDIMRLLSSGVPTPQKNNDTYLVESGIQGPQSLDPKAVWVFFIRRVALFLILFIWFGFGIILAFVNNAVSGVAIGLIILAAIFLIAYFWSKLEYRFYKYELTAEGISKEYGVIFKKYVTIPYERIQNINISRGILDRMLGLSELTIFTAGTASIGRNGYGAGAEGMLPGLSQVKADELRKVLIHKSKAK